MTRITALLALATTAAVAYGNAATVQMPPAIAAPGETTVVTYHAEGAQIYECKASSDGKLSWVFREPIATLILDGKTIGRHYWGPTWRSVEGMGSAVMGKTVGSAPGKTDNDIPWLKLDVVGSRGAGPLANATTIQRINTQGGAAQGTCDQAGAFRSVPYSADYVFLRKS
jgi:hypothetical protein